MYNPVNWYWIIGGSTTEVYSSKSNTLVPDSDQAYTDFLTVNEPNHIATEAELAGVVKNTVVPIPAWMWNATSFIQPAPGAFSKSQLAAYNADARYRRASGGCSVGGYPYLTDPVARNTVASAHDYAVVNPGHVTDWKLADGTFVQLNEAQLAHVLQQMATFVQACFTCESTNLTNINSGSITSLAQIDNAFAAISNVLA